MHALIIEDESLIAMAIEDALREIGFSTFDIAASPDEAIKASATRCPDLITSDVQLRPGCGISTVLNICESIAIPVIFITGNIADVSERLPDALTLSKPFSTGELASAVEVALRQPPPGL